MYDGSFLNSVCIYFDITILYNLATLDIYFYVFSYMFNDDFNIISNDVLFHW